VVFDTIVGITLDVSDTSFPVAGDCSLPQLKAEFGENWRSEQVKGTSWASLVSMFKWKEEEKKYE